MNLSTRPLAQNVTQGRGLEKDDNLLNKLNKNTLFLNNNLRCI